jgi:hypothetical protein
MLSKCCQITQQRAAADAKLLGQLAHGRAFTAAQKLGKLHQALGPGHLVTNSVTISA